uniref:atlastin-2-like isoform X2 n=1 Tax=Ciona intestinalis TaxID=7719 RepID=UPI000EF4D18F|nr:atlastin-2-like isoform X2 [Ciona intestinalis]|eukprot:XP_026696059.1 atlastin-2-like isoform X2 [Ciona intestinalis]
MASNTRQPELSEIKTVNILGFQNHNLNIKIDKLQEIFFGIKQPVAIISVAGAMRKGKSFMLNMLLHHLLKWNLNSRNPTGDEIIRNVFQCKGGNERVTIGINITDKPIILMNKVGEEVAVFLMDSEGLFDKKQSATVFAISTLLSSLQIFNVSEQIQECDLQYLQMFTNYTKLSAAHIGHSKAFPELLFLIRNYQLEDVWGVEEGQRYLEKFLQSDVEENQRVREVLGENFAHLRCFLLPHPGETVAKWKQTRQMWKPRKESKPNICFADINNKDFVAGVEELAEQLFGKEHLIVKKLCGDVITATEFIDLVPLYVKVFTGDDIPTPETITKVQNQCMFITKLRKLESEYCTAMSREVVDEYIPLEKLEDIHTKQLTQALKVLDSFSVILREDESKAERKYMEKRLQSAFHEIQTRNIAHKKKQIIEIKQCGEKAAELFRGWLKEAANGQYVEDISEERNVAKQKAFEAFNKCVQVYDKDLVKEYVSNLKKYIQSEDDQFIRKNAERLKSLTEKLEKKISCAAGAYMEIIENKYKETGKLLKVVKKAVQEYDTHFGKVSL